VLADGFAGQHGAPADADFAAKQLQESFTEIALASPAIRPV
jgi:hypothetical protein